MPKKYLGMSVLDAARLRIGILFDRFERIYVSFSGGKDSTVMLHLVADEARRRGRRFGLFFVDLEAQYRATITHVERCFELCRDVADPYWIALPLNLRNAVSQFEPQWTCWDPDRRADWVRQPPSIAITDPSAFAWYRHAMEFEELVVEFGRWFAGGGVAACCVGIRTAESLNRWRTIASASKAAWSGYRWTTAIDDHVVNAYPIYDWATEDIWTYTGRFGAPMNAIYDLMHRAGLSIHQQRICQPYGDDQRKGLYLFHLLEPETWCRVVARVNGANSGALYAQERGNILGRFHVSKPAGHTWQSFAHLLLDSQPPRTRENFGNKIAVFLKWWHDRGFPNGIPDEADPSLEASRKAPSWRRICKALLKNDYWCKTLSFSQHDSSSFERYRQLMRRRRSNETWNSMFAGL